METAPPMKGLEYLNSLVLARLWDELDAHVHAAIARDPGGAAAYLKSCNPLWNAVGRVTFHLAENKRNPAHPFAFLATYTNRVSEQGKVQHLPLGRALEEYAGAKNRAALAALLSPVQRAAEQSKVARQLLDSRAIFHPQVWRPEQAFAFLKEIPLFEQSGLVVRIPDWWKAGRPPRPQVSVRIGEAKGNLVGKDSLLDFQVGVSLEGEPLTESELKAILQSTSGLTLLKGKWVEVDRDKLQQVLEHWKKVQSAAGPDGLPLLEGLRLLSGFQPGAAVEAEAEAARADWSSVMRRPAIETIARGNAATGSFRRVRPRTGIAGGVASLSTSGRALALVHEPSSVWARVWPTTWVWAKPFKSSPCCWRSGADGRRRKLPTAACRAC